MAEAAGSCDGVLLLDKPAGLASARALARAKRLLGAARAGHTGTLDPFATGLLPLVFGEATKFARFLLDAGKAYEAVLRLGVETSTGDPEGEVVRRREVSASDERIGEVLASFVGAQEQVPPMHSALHVNGRRLYEYARAGEEVPRAARRVEIASLRVLFRRGDELGIAVACSKGTYIRALAADIGRALGCGASLTALRRTAVGPFRLDDAVTLEALEGEAAAGRARLLAPEVLVAGLPRVQATAEATERLLHGQEIAADAHGEGAVLALFGAGGRFLGVGVGRAGRIAPLRLVSGESAPRSP
ncbi:MAG TPA: tRNA pseudouridine(55) synthase TruB [Usitatibacter sp.]|nr:tRNA pseudouridine(55) synthase TruB [Usitatibacter sp.]